VIHLRIDPEYQGPTLVGIRPLLPLDEGAIEARWQGTKEEKQVLRGLRRSRSITLIVANLVEVEKAATSLGVGFQHQVPLMERTSRALQSQAAGTWASMVEEVGGNVARSSMLQVISTILRSGKDQPSMRKTVADSLLHGVRPADLDVLTSLHRISTKK
jgi:hypothetical protein